MANYIGLKAKGMGFDAHLTVMYTGDLDEYQEHQIRDILESLRKSHCVFRDEIKMFGPNNDIPVLTVLPEPSLWWVRKHLERLDVVPNPSEFNWNPHITLKWEEFQTLHIPEYIELDKLDLY